MASIIELIFRILADTAFQVLYIAGLLLVCTVVLLQLERIIVGMLSQTFGWKSVLWTAWLGTPIHELSHAAMCIVFFHRIDKMVLFNPNPRTGVLGYVQHAYNPQNPWSKVGCAFIGLAPLFGGALALILAMHFLVPSDPLGSLKGLGNAAFASSSGPIDQAVAAMRLSTAVFTKTFTSHNFTTPQFWLFLYLVLCIGTHIAPSKEDFAGSYSGFGAAIVALLLINVVAHVSGGAHTDMVRTTAHYVMPVVAMLMMAAVLNLVSLAGVFGLVVLYRMLRGDSWRAFFQTLLPHWKRLAIVGGIGLGLFLAATRM